MQIIVNARHLRMGKLDGIGWFSYQILKRITQNNPEVHFVFLFDRPYSEEFIFSDNVTPLIISPPAKHPVLFYAWNNLSVERLLKKMNPDLYISTDGMIPLHASCKTLNVIHDLNFKHNPKDLPFLTSKFYNLFYPKYAQMATQLVTVSEFSKQDLISSYQIPNKKIEIVHNGINESFYVLSAEERQKIRKEVSDSKPYFIYVGSLHTRKNIVRLLQAFEIFKIQTGSEVKLFLVGSIFWGKREINAQLSQMKYKNEVIFTGRLDDKKLNEVMNAALALTFVPYFEGFGIPLLEAMKVEIPIISANTTSLPEVAGDAALLVNPYQPEDIAKAMESIYKDKNLREDLVSKGKERLKNFSWDVSAEKFWQIVENTLKIK